MSARLTVEVGLPFSELLEAFEKVPDDLHRDMLSDGQVVHEWSQWHFADDIHVEAESTGCRCIVQISGEKIEDCEAFVKKLPGNRCPNNIYSRFIRVITTDGVEFCSREINLTEQEQPPNCPGFENFVTHMDNFFSTHENGFTILCGRDPVLLSQCTRFWAYQKSKEMRIFRADEPSFEMVLGTSEGIKFWLENAGTKLNPALLLVEGGEECLQPGICMSRTLRRNLLGLHHGLLSDVIFLHVLFAVNLPSRAIDPTLAGPTGASALFEI